MPKIIFIHLFHGKLETLYTIYLVYAVESSNNGHVGGMASVRCRELSASRGLLKYYYMYGNLIPFQEGCTL